jgi:hypothetical protein
MAEAKDPKPRQHELTAEEQGQLGALTNLIVLSKAQLYDLREQLRDAVAQKDALLLGIATARGFTQGVRLSEDGKRLVEG